MSGDPKPDEIMAALEEYVERQKKLIQDENQRLLREGQDAFERILAEKRDDREQPKPLEHGNPHRVRQVGQRARASLRGGLAPVKDAAIRLGTGAVTGLKRCFTAIGAATRQLRGWLRRARTHRSS